MRLLPSTAALAVSALCIHAAARAGAAEEVITYPGMETEAPWRVEALERIDSLRKGDLVVRVVDANGTPVKDAEVTVRQQRHAFRFSCDVEPEMLVEEGEGPAKEEKKLYREMVAASFNVIHPVEGASAELAQRAREWAQAHGFLDAAIEEETVEAPSRFEAGDLIPPVDLAAKLDELAKADKPLQALHYRFAVDPTDAAMLQLQAAYTRDYLTLLFSRPEVIEIGLDGFWAPSGDGRWGLYGREWAPRPVGDVYVKLVRKQWWTDDTALTNAAGECTIRCFLGEYRVSVASAGQMVTLNAALPMKEKLEIALAPAATPSPSETPE